MISNPNGYEAMRDEIRARLAEDRALLDGLRQDIRHLRGNTERIYPRSTTSISLVGTDGGNNQLRFDPFLIQLVRVVDSSANEYCMQVITPSTDIGELSRQEFANRTPLGDLMTYLGVSSLSDLSPMIPRGAGNRGSTPAWTQVYRELMEWAVLFKVLRDKDFATDTLIVFDGLLRSIVFAGHLFERYMNGLQEGINRHAARGRRIYLVGVAKSSKVLARYGLAMALEKVLATDYPAFVEISREVEQKVYFHAQWSTRNEQAADSGARVFAGGRMFFVKFGARPHDPIWPVDIFHSQVADAQKIMGCLLTDAIAGFPIPLYPLCLQKAHEHAALVDFDFDVMQDQVFEALRDVLAGEEEILDVFRLRDLQAAEMRRDQVSGSSR